MCLCCICAFSVSCTCACLAPRLFGCGPGMAECLCSGVRQACCACECLFFKALCWIRRVLRHNSRLLLLVLLVVWALCPCVLFVSTAGCPCMWNTLSVALVRQLGSLQHMSPAATVHQYVCILACASFCCLHAMLNIVGPNCALHNCRHDVAMLCCRQACCSWASILLARKLNTWLTVGKGCALTHGRICEPRVVVQVAASAYSAYPSKHHGTGSG